MRKWVGGLKILRMASILTSSEEPPPDRGGGTKRLRHRVVAACVATPSHEKTYPSAAPPGTSLTHLFLKKLVGQGFSEQL